MKNLQPASAPALLPAAAAGIVASAAPITGDVVDTTDGWIQMATVLPVAAGLRAAIRARIELMGPPNANQTREVLSILWSGYVRAGGIKASTPNLRVYHGWGVRVVAAGSGSLAGTARVDARVLVTPEKPAGEGNIVQEPDGPEAGLGDYRTISLGDPAAGATYANQTVPGQSLWLIWGSAMPLVNDATGGFSRVPTIAFLDGSANGIGGSGARPVNASIAGTIRWARGAVPSEGAGSNPGAGGATIPGGGVPLQVAQPADVVTFPISLAAGDNFGAGFMRVEEWAVI